MVAMEGPAHCLDSSSVNFGGDGGIDDYCGAGAGGDGVRGAGDGLRGAGDGVRSGGVGVRATAWAICCCAMRYLSCKSDRFILWTVPHGICSAASVSASYKRCFVCRCSPVNCFDGDGVACASTGTFSRGVKTSCCCC